LHIKGAPASSRCTHDIENAEKLSTYDKSKYAKANKKQYEKFIDYLHPIQAIQVPRSSFFRHNHDLVRWLPGIMNVPTLHRPLAQGPAFCAEFRTCL
jgi:hypothetical protein